MSPPPPPSILHDSKDTPTRLFLRECALIPFALLRRHPPSAMPGEFLGEYGLEFAYGAGAFPGAGGGVGPRGLEGDLELSSSLLTMSLDNDIPLDEMALSAGERSLLARPMAEDAMAALVSSAVGDFALPVRAKGRGKGRKPLAHSPPAGPLVPLPDPGESGGESGGASSLGRGASGGRPSLSDLPPRRSAASRAVRPVQSDDLSPTGFFPASSLSTSGSFTNLEYFDGNLSGDLVDLVNSPSLLWSLGPSSLAGLSPSQLAGCFKPNDDELATNVAAPRPAGI